MYTSILVYTPTPDTLSLHLVWINVYQYVTMYTSIPNTILFTQRQLRVGGDKGGVNVVKNCGEIFMTVWDKWQQDVLEAEGNIVVNCGRQVGKTTVISRKTAEYISKYPKKKVLIISVTEQQAENMLAMIVLQLHDINPKSICKGSKRPTKHRVELLNGSIAITKAVGQYGLGALGLTCDVVVPDECAYLPETIWQSITPMLLTTGGSLWLLSTPNAQEGYFYEAYTNSAYGFKTFHVNSEEVANSRPEPQRSIMLSYLEREKQRMSPMQYAQQYLAQFQEELGQLFPDKLIQNSQVLDRPTFSSIDEKQNYFNNGCFFLGVDVARMGGDETTFEILERKDKKYYQRENFVTRYTLTTETISKVIELDRIYNFKNIYIDDGGLGVAVFDQLLSDSQTKSKVIAINNASRSLDRDESRKRKLLKEDLYLNFLAMLEKQELFLLRDPDIFTSLKSIMIEHDVSKANIKIYGRYSHITEGLIRAAWSNHSTRLNLWVR